MKFAAENLIVVEGEAPEVLEDLEAPTHAFIGGSSGNMKAIMELLLRKNPRVRIVINCIAMESVAEALRCLKELPVTVSYTHLQGGRRCGSPAERGEKCGVSHTGGPHCVLHLRCV